MLKAKLLNNTKKIVIKLGSQTIASENRIDENFIDNLARQVKILKDKNKDILIVSSGAVLSGIIKLNHIGKPKSITEKQALASVGQAYLIQIYDRIFSKYNLHIGQILLTIEGLQERKRYVLAQNTLNKLLDMGIVPIVNENDTVGVEEILFGDNDFLAAHVSILSNANLLIILSTAGGLYTDEPSNPSSRLLTEIKNLEEAIKYAKSSKSKFGSGGMRSKLEASQLATSHGIPVVIAPKKENVVIDILSNKSVGTFIYPETDLKKSRKKSWLEILSVPKGKIIIDKGAEIAVKNGKSLLPAGVKDIEGIFNRKDTVAIENLEGKIIGKGIIEYNYKDMKEIKGLKSENIKDILGYFKEVIHRDNLILFEKE